MRKSALAMVFVIVHCLGGCIAALDYGPARLYTDDEQNKLLRATLPPVDFNHVYEKPERNAYITARMYAIDLNYTAYFTKLTKERQLGTLGSDLAVVGLGAATAVIGGVQTKAILGAATTAVGGARSDIDKDVLLSQTVQILQNEMEVQRSKIRGRILINLQMSSAEYTIAQGLSDLEDYYRAGTLAGAFESLSSSVGAASQQQKVIKDDGVKVERSTAASPVL